MTFSGHIRDGQIVLEGNPKLPEGADVRVDVMPAASAAEPPTLPPLGRRLMQFAGKAVGLPKDAARNHDHYLYGTPKQ
jgi:hypothetical protein